MKTFLMASVFGGALLIGSAADAAVLNGTFAVSIYTADTPTNNGSFNTQFALPTNPVVANSCNGNGTNGCSNRLTGTTTYTGLINFNDPSNGTNTIAGFLNTGTGSYTTITPNIGSTVLSSGGFSHVTVMSFTFTPSATYTGVVINHDDGISLYEGATLLLDAAGPTTSTPTNGPSLLAGHTYTLWYAEANGLPGVLNVTGTVPEPASLALLGAGLASLGVVRRRRRS